MTKHFKFIAEENRYVLEEIPDGGADGTPNTPDYQRVFQQVSVLHTSDDVPHYLTRAYNLEDEISINDAQLKLGARERGQKLNEVSGGNHIKDNKPESGF
jgi:hypothetical protein